MSESDIPSAYVREKRSPAPSREELRARIPGWGVDLDPADRPSNPKLLHAPDTGARWDFPERQPEHRPRERSIEHAFVTPVFGTAQPLKGASGAIRRLAYARFSEGRLAHWMLLVVGDRVDAVEHHLRSFATLRPDVPATGVRTELTHGGLASRRGRVDARHHVLDPLVVGGPWLVAAGAAVVGVRRLVRAARR
ncbi:hypothetical protein [Blastococcus sp. TF02A-35]|uniref:hypothetical protein n=1 Tax=Blastococcus sp. TF02A-35 TaxID=2559612 RepID=UPI0010732F10|nr:hypothetical protein [Blastococcus sp. TF02A_35]TFV46222.1 hypothetical protein E4P43_16710 [Blastococcus sp. TF02A_35]